MDSKTEPASEAKERIEELELENERLKQAYKYIHASRNSVDEELNEANKEITRLKAELERERELRMELVEDVKNKTITEVLDLLPKYQNAFILENDYAYLKLDISRKRTA